MECTGRYATHACARSIRADAGTTARAAGRRRLDRTRDGGAAVRTVTRRNA
jgi:hypothetical protein